jgi:hypothetical protein
MTPTCPRRPGRSTRTFSYSTARRVVCSSNSHKSSLPTGFSRRSPLQISEDRISRYREACKIVLVQSNTKTLIPDGQRSTSGYRYSRCRRPALLTSELRTRDATCCAPHNFRGSHRNSGLRGLSVLPSTSKSPKCRIPIPRDLVPPVPPTMDGSNQIGGSRLAISTCM